ncbi:hypothetical protein [Nannocystis pusilla]|uniref:hypothetical protein n=1 Tax=Nannocystis pusilla TaxID=889268 RepID=UPI003B77B4AC
MRAPPDPNRAVPDGGGVAQKVELVDIDADGFVDLVFADSRGEELGGEPDAQLAGVFEERPRLVDPSWRPRPASRSSHILFNLGHGVSLRQDLLRRCALQRGRPRALGDGFLDVLTAPKYMF